MRYLLLLALLACSAVDAATIRVIPPTAYTDGELIPEGTAFLFRLYGAKCGQELRLLTPNGFTALEYTRNPVGVGDHCYATTAAVIDSNGVPGPESARSAGYTLTVPAEPEPEPPKPVARETNPPTDAVLEQP